MSSRRSQADHDLDLLLGKLFSALLGENPEESHRHQCRRCGLVWEHKNSCNGDADAHKCQCGEFVRERFFGEGAVAVEQRNCMFVASRETVRFRNKNGGR